MTECIECGTMENVIEHHTSYERDETVPLCRPCHGIVHGEESHPLHPEDPENAPYKNNQARVPDTVYGKASEIGERLGMTIGEAIRLMCREGGHDV